MAPTGIDLCPTPHLSLPRGNGPSHLAAAERLYSWMLAEGLEPSIEVCRQLLTDTPALLTSGQGLEDVGKGSSDRR